MVGREICQSLWTSKCGVGIAFKDPSINYVMFERVHETSFQAIGESDRKMTKVVADHKLLMTMKN